MSLAERFFIFMLGIALILAASVILSMPGADFGVAWISLFSALCAFLVSIFARSA